MNNISDFRINAYGGWVVPNHITLKSDVDIPANSIFGDNCVIGASCVIGDNVILGENCVIREHCEVHDRWVLGYNCTVMRGVSLGNGGMFLNKASVAKGVLVGKGSTFGAQSIADSVYTTPGVHRYEVGSLIVFEPGIGHDGLTVDDHYGFSVNPKGGLLIPPGEQLCADTDIPAHSVLSEGCLVGENSSVGAHTIISDYCHISKNCIVDSTCIIADTVTRDDA